MKGLMLLVLAVFLTACGTTRGKQAPTAPVEFKVPVAVPCIKSKPVAPNYQYGVGAYPGDEAASVLMASDLEAAKQYGRDWESAAAGCLVVPKPAK